MASKEHNDLERVLEKLEQPSRPGENIPTSAPAGLECQSPTVAALDLKRRPNPTPVCETCPHSMWFASAAHLKCYCRVMHVVTWNSDDPVPILSCDGILINPE